jgi:hypothetical protein
MTYVQHLTVPFVRIPAVRNQGLLVSGGFPNWGR